MGKKARADWQTTEIMFGVYLCNTSFYLYSQEASSRQVRIVTRKQEKIRVQVYVTLIENTVDSSDDNNNNYDNNNNNVRYNLVAHFK